MSDISAPPPPELDWTTVTVVHTSRSQLVPDEIVVVVKVLDQDTMIFAKGGFAIFCERHTGKKIRIHTDGHLYVNGCRSWRDPNEKPKPIEEIALIVEPPPTTQSRLVECYLQYLEKDAEGDASTFLDWVRDEVTSGDLQLAANDYLDVGGK